MLMRCNYISLHYFTINVFILHFFLYQLQYFSSIANCFLCLMQNDDLLSLFMFVLSQNVKMTTCLLQQKTFYCREWVFTKLLHCLDSRATAKTCGALVMGGPGSGKTAVCSELVWPTSSSRASSLTQHMLAYYFCQAHDAETLLITNFLHCLADQVRVCDAVWCGI